MTVKSIVLLKEIFCSFQLEDERRVSYHEGQTEKSMWNTKTCLDKEIQTLGLLGLFLLEITLCSPHCENIQRKKLQGLGMGSLGRMPVWHA